MTRPNNQRSMYVRAFEHQGYWTVKIALDSYDREGTPDEVVTLRTNARIPSTDDDLDQCWLVLVTALHYLEAQGAAGRISGVDWPALPI